ncbi:hypothetical protein [Clostridium minihomine]|nr:hypothetical protein [Clostridium minihomine]
MRIITHILHDFQRNNEYVQRLEGEFLRAKNEIPVTVDRAA